MAIYRVDYEQKKINDVYASMFEGNILFLLIELL